MGFEKMIAYTAEDLAAIEGLLECSDRDRLIVGMRFGIGCEPMTMKAIGEAVGLSGQRVRQIVEKALHRARIHAKRQSEQEQARALTSFPELGGREWVRLRRDLAGDDRGRHRLARESYLHRKKKGKLHSKEYEPPVRYSYWWEHATRYGRGR